MVQSNTKNKGGKKSLLVPQKIKNYHKTQQLPYDYHMIPQLPKKLPYDSTPGYTFWRTEREDSNTYFYTTPNSGRVTKCGICNGIVFLHKKESSSDTYYNVNEPQKHYANWKKLHTGHILYGSTYTLKIVKMAILQYVYFTGIKKTGKEHLLTT